MFKVMLSLFIAGISVCLVAQEPKEITLVHAGTLLAVPGEAVTSEQTIVIEKGRVIEIRAGFLDQSAFPEGSVEIIDLSNQFVLPGLMDMHVHLTLNGFPGDFSKLSDSDMALTAVENAYKTVMSGFTTVRDLGAFRAESIIAVRDAIDRGGIVGPRIIAAGQPISATAGHGDIRGLRLDISNLLTSNATCNGAEDCRRAVREQYKLGATTIKLHATGGGADPNGGRNAAPEMFDDEMKATVETAHRLNLKVAAHAHGTAGIQAALNAGVDSIEHGSWLDDATINLFLKTGAYLVPTAYLQDFFLARPQIPQAVQEVRRQNVAYIHPQLSLAMQRGVKIAMGTDAGIMPHGQSAHEIAKYVELGMTPMQAIQTATVNAADLMDMETEIGALKPGMIADLIAVSGNPLEDIHLLESVDFVMRSGKILKQ